MSLQSVLLYGLSMSSLTFLLQHQPSCQECLVSPSGPSAYSKYYFTVLSTPQLVPVSVSFTRAWAIAYHVAIQ